MRERAIHIIMYHYVRDLADSAYPTIKGLDRSRFIRQVEYLMERYHPLRMEELLDAYRSGEFSSIPENSFLLTFDDGYIDHYEVVWPILRRYGIQGSFFPSAKAVKENTLLTVNRIHFILAAAEMRGEGAMDDLLQDCFRYLDDYRGQGVAIPANEALYRELAVANRWDTGRTIFIKRILQNALPEDVRTQIARELFRKWVGKEETAFARKLYLNVSQIKEMKRDGMFFGLHGYDHYWLGMLEETEMENDIDCALEFMKEVIDLDSWVMNYPYGDHNGAVAAHIKKKGCKLAVATRAGAAYPAADDRYALPRWDCNDVFPEGTYV